MYIGTTELLEFLTKAQELNIFDYFVKTNLGYEIALFNDWQKNGNYYQQKVFITKEGESTWDYGDCEFSEMNEILDKMIEEKEQKKIKEQKRKELIARLTDEEKELLGIQ